MMDSTDYSVLFSAEEGYTDTWRDIYDASIPLPLNLLTILHKTILLPYEFYDIIAAYFMLPSAICRVVPYLFLCGQSGSGKSTLAKLAAYLHGVAINSSSDTFAGIRNGLEERRQGIAKIPVEGDYQDWTYKKVEKNTCMVWDDISPHTFTSQPDLYNMFKFGYDRTTDKIVISSKEVGENLEFHCFSPKIFSSISPLHLDDRLKELRRRMIVIHCKRIEELSEERQLELGVTSDNWQSSLIDLNDYDWKGFHQEFIDYWDIDRAKSFLVAKRGLSQSLRGLTSQQRGISLDLLACGLSCGIWSDKEDAISAIKTYWEWFRTETSKSAGIAKLLSDFIKQEQRNAKNGNQELEISTVQLRTQVDNFVAMGWLYEKPRPSDVKEAMLDLGLRLEKGVWRKD